MNIKLCKLTDGTVVIGELDDDYIKDAIQLVTQQSERDIQVIFVPVLYPFNREMSGINISTSKIVVKIDVAQEMIDQYITNRTGLVRATSVPSEM